MPDAASSRGLTGKLQAWGDGDREALAELMPAIYDELHRQAARYLHRERPGHTLQTTALINETYIKLVEQKGVHWKNRAHFFGISARLMREVLIDHARTKHRQKRGGSKIQVPFEEAETVAPDRKEIDLLILDEALRRLAELDRQQERIVEMKYFAGLSIEEIAHVLDISVATVKRDWQVARAWLYRELSR